MKQGKLISSLLALAIVSVLVVCDRQGEVIASATLSNHIIYFAQGQPASPDSNNSLTSSANESNKFYFVFLITIVTVIGVIGWQAWRLWQTSRKKNEFLTQAQSSDEGERPRYVREPIEPYVTPHSIPENQGKSSRKTSNRTSSGQHSRRTFLSQREVANVTGTFHQPIKSTRQISSKVTSHLGNIKEKDLVALYHRPLKILHHKTVIVTTTAELLEIYNHVPKLLERRVIEVVVNPDSLSSQNLVILHKQKPGNYWVIKTDTNQDWLLPKRNKKFSIHEYSVLESLFECQGFHREGSRNFIVKEPGKISANPNEEEWKLEAKGVLEFTQVYSSTNEQAGKQKEQLFSALKANEQTIEQLQEQLQKSDKKNEKLQNRLEKSETERQQIMSLLYELQEEVKQQREERQRLLYFLDDKNKNSMRDKSTPSKQEKVSDIQQNSLTKSPKKEIPSTRKVKKLISHLESIQNEEDLVAFYNHNPRALEKKIIVVTTTEDSFEQQRAGYSAPIIFQSSPTGNYWITLVPHLPSPYYFLVPQANLVVNRPKYATLKKIFDCEEYQTKTSNKFKLIRPAVVTSEPEGYWKLYDLGELEFV